MAKQNTSKSIVTKKPLIYFALNFLLIFTFFLLIYPMKQNSFVNYWIDTGNSFFRSYVSTDLSLNRSVTFVRDNENKNVIVAQTIFYERINEDGTIQSKGIKINLFNEAYFPFIFPITLIISIPIVWRRKWFSLIIGIILTTIFIYFKLFAIVADNYSYPELAVKPLPLLISQLVYLYNMALTATGTGTNIIFGLLICIIAFLRKSEVGILLDYINKKTASN